MLDKCNCFESIIVFTYWLISTKREKRHLKLSLTPKKQSSCGSSQVNSFKLERWLNSVLILSFWRQYFPINQRSMALKKKHWRTLSQWHFNCRRLLRRHCCGFWLPEAMTGSDFSQGVGIRVGGEVTSVALITCDSH